MTAGGCPLLCGPGGCPLDPLFGSGGCPLDPLFCFGGCPLDPGHSTCIYICDAGRSLLFSGPKKKDKSLAHPF